VGPYALFGEPLIKVCAETGTDYCDLTGEVQWLREMIHKYQATAESSGARIVNCCGFDSIPSDLGVYFIQQEAQTRFGQPLTCVKMRVKAAKGEFSGGTVASLLNVVKEASSNPELRKELANPYSVCPPNHGFTARQPNVKSAEYDRDFQAWTAPFVMAAINTRVVHRSNALSDKAYGADFRYDEAMMTGRGLKGRVAALGVTGALGGFMVGGGASHPLVAGTLCCAEARRGEGPLRRRRRRAFRPAFLWRDPDGESLWAKVTGDRDPGYGSTSKMLGQAGVCLAKDLAGGELPGVLDAVDRHGWAASGASSGLFRAAV